jgi:hypothetical protein
MRKIYAKVKEGTSEPNSPAKSKEGGENETPPTTPSPRKKAPAATGAKARGHPKRKLAEEDEEEHANGSTKKARQVKKEIPAEDEV